MKIMFFGLGSIGLRQAQLLIAQGGHELHAFRSVKKAKRNPLGIREIYDWKFVDKVSPDVAFITNPTALHLKTANECAKRGIHLFIEKPLDCDVKDLDRFLKVVKTKRIATYVAYVLRFHPVILALRKLIQRRKDFLHMRIQTSSYLPLWRPGTSHLKIYSSRTKLGGGVIFDLSHELDYVEFLLGDIKQMHGRFDRRSQVTVDTEDFADILLKTKRGPVNVHVNFLSQIRQRKIQIDFSTQSYKADLISSTLSEYRRGELVKTQTFPYGIKECYAVQLKYFLKHMPSTRMMNNAIEAAPLLRKIYAFKKKGFFHG